MADRTVEIRFGMAAAALVAAAVLLPLCAVLWRAGGFDWLGPSDWAAVKFTVVQAVLSALISVALAIPVARALARRSFWGRGMLITLMGAPFILPVIVAVLGLIAVFGRNGVLNTLLGVIGLEPLTIYGFHGVVLVHVFLNLPLATRILLQGWQGIAGEHLRLAATLDCGTRDLFCLIEWPMLRQVLPGAVMIIFVICLSSFAVALTLGGGPRATTVELAIYQAFRFDFDMAKAAGLGIVQLALVGAASLIALRYTGIDTLSAGHDRKQEFWIQPHWSLDAIVLICAALFLVVPLGMIVLRGLGEIWALPPQVWKATGISIAVSLASVVITLGIAMPIALAAVHRRWLESVSLLGIAMSPLVIGTGAFIVLRPVTNPADWALVLSALANALMAMPFVMRLLMPEARQIHNDYARLSDALGMSDYARLRWVIVPRMRSALGYSAGLTAALSMGDLGVIALFSDPERVTLPLQVYRLMGSYRTDAAMGAALLLMVTSLALFWLFDERGRRRA